MNVSSIGHYGGECSEPIDLGPHRTGASRGAHSQGRGCASRQTPKQEVIGVLVILLAANPFSEEGEDQRREAGHKGIDRRPRGWSRPRADRLRSEPLTAAGKRLLHALLGAGSADSSYTVRMPSGHGVEVEDRTDLR